MRETDDKDLIVPHPEVLPYLKQAIAMHWTTVNHNWS